MRTTYYARRIGAVFYDGLLLLAFWLLASFGLVLIAGHALISPQEGTLARLPYWTLLLLIAWLFFAWFWTHGGQTLGMRAWRLKLIPVTERQATGGLEVLPRVPWRKANLRFIVSCAIWILAGMIVPLVWSAMRAAGLESGLDMTSTLLIWAAFSFFLSTIPLAGGLSLVDYLSGTRVIMCLS